jgi:hypothetical protein
VTVSTPPAFDDFEVVGPGGHRRTFSAITADAEEGLNYSGSFGDYASPATPALFSASSGGQSDDDVSVILPRNSEASEEARMGFAGPDGIARTPDAGTVGESGIMYGVNLSAMKNNLTAVDASRDERARFTYIDRGGIARTFQGDVGDSAVVYNMGDNPIDEKELSVASSGGGGLGGGDNF